MHVLHQQGTLQHLRRGRVFLPSRMPTGSPALCSVDCSPGYLDGRAQEAALRNIQVIKGKEMLQLRPHQLAVPQRTDGRRLRASRPADLSRERQSVLTLPEDRASSTRAWPGMDLRVVRPPEPPPGSQKTPRTRRVRDSRDVGARLKMAGLAPESVCSVSSGWG